MTSLKTAIAAILSAVVLSACAGTGTLTSADVADLELINPQVVSGSVMTGGQPTQQDLERLRQSGVTTIVTLRRDDEDPGYDEKAAVETLGMTYVNLPVSMDALNADTAAQLRAILGETEGPALVHCGSGNRVGAIFAIGAHEIDGKPVEEALEIGRAAGLTRLEPRIKEILETDEATSSP